MARLKVDREAAARFGTDVLSIGSAVLVTNGLILATYRPEDVRDEVDIAVRLPNNWRELEQLQRQTINTPRGQVALSEFVTLEPGDKTGTIVRVDGQRTVTIKSDVAPGRRMDELLRTLQAEMPEPPEGVTVRFAGENEDQQQAANFLVAAFLVAVGLMLLILCNPVQLPVPDLPDSVGHCAVHRRRVAGAAVWPAGVVMVGMGIIALAGIVVNNNIILIDTYNR